MTRLGVSPSRRKPSNYQPARITLAVLTFIPEMEGYYRHRLDVLRACLESLLLNTEGEYDLLVFDNGSCPEVVDYLRRLNLAGQIDILMLSSRNIGQIGALQAMFRAAPGEYIAYCDDDILFYPGWLPAQMEIFDTFPIAGFVSGAPVRDAARHTAESNQRFEDDPPPGLVVSKNRWIPDDWEIDWAASTGRDPDKILAESSDKIDLLYEYKGLQVYPAANHFQYIARRDVLLAALPVDQIDNMMAPMVELEKGVDRQGLLRLSTTQRFVRHIGNVVSPELADELRSIGIDIEGKKVSRRPRRHWILEIPRMRPLLERIYGKLYDILNHVQSE